jgi:succinate dehydrogenase / fumarate reductase flavoprotein subunit
MSESLRNDGRVWVPNTPGDKRAPMDIPEDERDYYLERKYPSYGNLAPRDIASRAAKQVCDEGRGVGKSGLGVYLDFSQAIERLGLHVIQERYGNLFDMYKKITDENPYRSPMRIYPASHYTMGGLWVDYELMSNLPGLFVLGEANFSDHGANRLGASALMQGLADGYFILPYTICHYLNSISPGSYGDADQRDARDALEETKERIDQLFSIRGSTSPHIFHRDLGKIIWDHCGMARDEKGLQQALQMIPELEERFYRDLAIAGEKQGFNQTLEKALRVSDFLKLAPLMCRDALMREESCGGHFREEYQTKDHEALRNDDEYCYVAAWKYEGENKTPSLLKEPLGFESVSLQQRSYK